MIFVLTTTDGQNDYLTPCAWYGVIMGYLVVQERLFEALYKEYSDIEFTGPKVFVKLGKSGHKMIMMMNKLE